MHQGRKVSALQRTMSWFKFGFLCVLAFTAFFILRGRISAQTAVFKGEETVLRVQLSELLEDIDGIQAEIADVGSDAYIERHARTEYQFIKPGELRFGFTNEEALSAYTTEEKAIYEQEMLH